MKFLRVLARVALLSLAAAAFTGLTEVSCRSVRPPAPDPVARAERQHRALEPRATQFPEFVGYVFMFVFWAAIGRMLRLRLSPASRSEVQPILLNLHKGG